MPTSPKIFNDPVYGFINIPSEFIMELIDHPYFQRLRRIKQLGLTDFVYPGAVHSRFHNALGAMYLMNEAISVLQSKGVLIMEIEKEAALIAILLHDLGHGPFSHVLEQSILTNVHHEDISLALMRNLNEVFDGRLTLAIEIFMNSYHRGFFHQLVSSQLDVDRLDYLNRDSFYTGVVEGKVGAERIIKMLNVKDNNLVVEEKGILSVENFLLARRHMYWQVYLHKTALCAEVMLGKILERVRYLKYEAEDNLSFFIRNDVDLKQLNGDPQILEKFISLDDYDVWSKIKIWANDLDPVLSLLCKSLLNRDLFKISFNDGKKAPVSSDDTSSMELQPWFYFEGSIEYFGYKKSESNIKILMKNNTISDISEVWDDGIETTLIKLVKKNYICFRNTIG